MRALAAVSGLALLLLGTSAALASPAKNASIEKLMAVTHVKELTQGVPKQVDARMNGYIRRALNGKSPNLKQQQAIARMKKRVHALLRQELAWDKLEPAYVRMYKETFSEEEVQGMLSFYRTPAGRAVIEKMPLLMQKTISFTEQTLGEYTPQLRQAVDQFRTDMKAASD